MMREGRFVFGGDSNQDYTCHSWVGHNYFNSEISEKNCDCDREAMQNHVLRIIAV